MVAVKFFKSAFIRQLSEAVRLRRRTQQPHIEVMNSRGEYSRTHLPRLVVENQDNPDLDNENGKRENVGKATDEFGSNTKSVDYVPKDDDMPQRVKSVKQKTRTCCLFSLMGPWTPFRARWKRLRSATELTDGCYLNAVEKQPCLA